MKSLALITLGSALFAALPAAAQTSAYALLTADGNLAFAIDGQPDTPTSALPVLGLMTGDVLVAIDVRPQNGRLYGLGQNPKLGTVRLYHLDIYGAAVRATSVGEAGGFVDANGNPLLILAQAFDIDFNPTVDRLRVIASNGLNFRMNPNNGALIDGNFNITMNPPAGVNPDASLNGGGGGAMGTAYTNNAINVSVTTQYTLDHLNDTLYIQNPPNAGTLVAALPITSNGAPLNFSADGGLDIEPGISVTSSGSAAQGSAAAALTVGGQSRLYRINLADGTTQLQGSLGGLNVVDIAVVNLPATVNTLSLSGTQLARFALAAPGAVATANVTGVVAGERLVAIDQRPNTAQLYALGIDANNDRGTIYVLEPQSAGGTALASPVGAPGRIQYFDENSVAVDLSDLPVGLDFNPFVDRIRIVDASGLNARANPNDGAPIDGNGSVPLVNPDGPVQAQVGTQLVATAYTSNFTMPTATTQYTLDQFAAQLFIQNPPNGGNQTLPLALTIGGAPFVFSSDTGFDIPPGPTSAMQNTPAPGLGYFTANSPAGAATLYEINLADAVVRSLGTIGMGSASLTGLVAYSAPAQVAFETTSILVDESNQPAAVQVLLLGGGSAPVYFRTSDGTAIAGQDYTATRGTLFLSAANPQATIEIPINVDALEEPDETFTVQLSGPFVTPTTLTITIRNRGDAIFATGFESL